MPVIGRLDRQVDELIISPVSRRSRADEPPPARQNEEMPDPTPPQTPPADESSANTDELPVWLL